MNKFLISFLLLCITLLTGCSIDNINDKSGGQEGSVSLNLSPNSEVVYKSGQSGVDLFDTPNISDFKIQIYNSNQELYAGFPKFSEMPSPTRLKAGSYTIVASHGANAPAAFDAPYFRGEAPFTINGSGNTPLSFACKIENVLIGVEYTDKFKAVFNNYSLDVMTEHTVNEEGKYEALRFVGDDKRIGFVRVAPIVYLSVSLHKIDTDKDYRYGVTPLSNIKGGEYYKLVFDTDANGSATVSITLNDETQSTPLDVTLGEEYLSKLEPKINTTFDSTQPYIFRYGSFGSKNPTIAAINAPGGIKTLVMEVNSEYAQQKGVPETIDFSTITSDVEVKLRDLGIECSKTMIGASSGRISFTKMFATLDPEMAKDRSEHIFKINGTDNYDRPFSKDLTFEVLPLILEMRGINDYDVWAKHAKFNEVVIKDVSPEEAQTLNIKYQVSVKGAEWVDIQDYNIENGVVSLSKLSDNTEYKVRAAVSGVYSDEIAFTTEEAKNVPNASFEENYSEKFNTNPENITYYPYLQGEENPFWQTLNLMTTGNKLKEYYKSYPCATVVTDASHGSNAIKLQTVGWGSGSSSPWGMLSALIPRPSYTVPGKLFIGDFVDSQDYNSGKNSMKQGKPFNSRPTSIDFDYKFATYNTIIGSEMQVYVLLENRAADGAVTVIANGEFKWSTKGDSGPYKTQNIPLTYTNTQMKATHISMSFQSQEDKSIGITELKGYDVDGRSSTTWDRRTTGSSLFVDNIVLKY